jgi:hypothetical protein
MVVQSIALPATGGSRDQELGAPPPGVAAAPVDPVRSFSCSPAFVPLLIATQAAWLTLLGYGVVHFLL